MHNKMTGLLGLLLLGTTWSALAAPPGSGKDQQRALDAALSAIVEDTAHPLASLSVLAISQGKVSYQQQFGYRHIGATPADSLPVTPATLFRIASVSKMVTTLGLMRLLEQGKLSLDQDVSIYLGFSLRNPHFPQRPVTLRSLLSHTSSLRDAGGYAWGPEHSLRDVFTAGGDAMWDSSAAPGSYFTYSNLNWGVIGTVMEKVTGERFDLLMRRLLLDPLDVRGGYHPAAFTADEVENTATLYRKRTLDTEIWQPHGPWIAQADDFYQRPPAGLANYVIGSNATVFSPTGGLRISAAGLGTVMQMLLDGGRHEGKQLLQPASIALMFGRQWQLAPNAHNGDSERGLYRAWGLGNQQFDAVAGRGNGLVEGASFSAVGHLGDAYGLVSAFVLDFKHKNGMVMLVGGTGSDPERYPGTYSAMGRSEELILTTLYRGAIDKHE
ncbi:serine hydrolase [Janthinobacterium sp. GW460P]|uniref:serine hydrolase domain-containing protein n=1 Tax=unclassified Janthinobacterium TaxID=2610881 RepID=UPI000A328BAB|nr:MULTISPECIES: serine hydrolase [unclassified Janthinobacterium]MCC7703632.1 serine hydrolase [Janthinobacterium sp. GW460P]MCC7709139.1 serine hydrolase [Janthinobacterium sp. GW460W]